MPNNPYKIHKTVGINKKNRGFFKKSIWVYRYRIYTLISIFVLVFVLYSSSINIPSNIQAYGYKRTSSNIIYDSIKREDTDNQLEFTPTVYVIADESNPVELPFNFTPFDLKERLKQLNIDSGLLNVDTMKALGIQLPIEERVENIPFSRYESEVEKLGTPLQTLIPAPANALNSNFIRISDYNVNAPIIYASFEDMFEKGEDGLINFGEPKDASDPNSPLQQRLRDGVVHIPFTPYPGEIGNSYIVGHSSNFAFVQSDYNEVFKPIERRGKNGEIFTIYDPFGRELQFRIFETLLIEEEDYELAYKRFEDRRVATLQTSVVTFRPENGWQPYQRWLVRGELLCGDDICSE